MFSDPNKIIAQCSIQAGQEIADFGSGSGSFTLAGARALISTGKIFAIDVHKDLLTKLKNEAVQEGLYNVEVIWADMEKIGGTKLRDNSIDLVFLCNTLFQLEDKNTTIQEIKRVLKQGGRVLVVDWDSPVGIGPRADMVVSRVSAEQMFKKAGFHLDRDVAAGNHHYGFIVKKL